MIFFLIAMGWADAPERTPDAAAGKDKAITCAGCHGADGNSVTPMWPSLSGQDPEYLTKQLRDFREGVRVDPMMSSLAKPLSDNDIADLSAWFASQPRAPATFDEEAARAGERYYRFGWPNEGRAPCIGCHGSRGLGFRGVIPSGFPPIGSQQPTYTAKQLNEFRAARRTNDYNGMMRAAAARLTDAEIAAIAAYVGSLRPNPPRAAKKAP